MTVGTSDLGRALTAEWRSPGVRHPFHVTRWRLVFDHDRRPSITPVWARVFARALGRTVQGDWFWLGEWHSGRWQLIPFAGIELKPRRPWLLSQARRLRKRHAR